MPCSASFANTDSTTVDGGDGLKDRRRLIECAAENGFRIVKSASHACVLATLSGEQKRELRPLPDANGPFCCTRRQLSARKANANHSAARCWIPRGAPNVGSGVTDLSQ